MAKKSKEDPNIFSDDDYHNLAYEVYTTANYRWPEYVNWKNVCKGYVNGYIGSNYKVDHEKLYKEVKKLWHDEVAFRMGKDAADTLCECLEKKTDVKSSAEEIAEEIPKNIERQHVVSTSAYNTAAR